MTSPAHRLDILFICEHPLWPLDQGFRVHGVSMARALRDMGLGVGVACLHPLPHDAPTDLHRLAIPWPQASAQDQQRFLDQWRGPGRRLRHRVAHYQGCDLARFAGVVPLVARERPAAVVALGQHGPILLRGLPASPDTLRVWYAADELVSFQLSCMRRERPAQWPARLRSAAVYTALENGFARGLDGAIGVSPGDTRLLRRLAGVRQAVTIRNGVDLAYFAPGPDDCGDATPGVPWRACPTVLSNNPQMTQIDTDEGHEKALKNLCASVKSVDFSSSPAGTAGQAFPGGHGTRRDPMDPPSKSLVFWGRMDFEPNVDAVCHFARTVWPQVRAKHPEATWRIVGKYPTPKVRALAEQPGVTVTGAVPDIRPEARQAAATVLPMRCGRGIKNKLLEAAAMGRPILASPKAVKGLDYDPARPPFLLCRTPAEWVQAIEAVWTAPTLGRTLGTLARRWVEDHHSWPAAACRLVDFLAARSPHLKSHPATSAIPNSRRQAA